MLNSIKKTNAWKRVSQSYIYVYMREISKIKKIIKKYQKKYSFALASDIINERRLNKVPYDEYFLFGFDNCTNNKERHSYVTDIERVEFANKLNKSENDHIFYDKYITYEVFGKFYGRDVLRIKSYDDKAQFEKFISRHPKFISKPIDGGCGKGIKIFDTSAEKSKDLLLKKLLNEYKGKCIIENLIIQAEEMKSLHPESVNTLRVPTVRFDDRVEIIHPFLRVGQGGSVTDNAGSGGIICAFDPCSSEVFATADEFGNTYNIQPDTKKQLIGFKIPRWNEACAMVKELAYFVPDNRYCSWDLALTEKGWIMVEVNAKGQFVWQYATKIGFRDEMNAILNELT